MFIDSTFILLRLYFLLFLFKKIKLNIFNLLLFFFYKKLFHYSLIIFVTILNIKNIFF